MNKKSNKKKKVNSRVFGGFKTILYLALLVFSLLLLNFVFGWRNIDEIPSFLQPYSSIILWVNSYLAYIQSALIFVFGYLSLNGISSFIYTHFLQITDHPTAAAIRSIFRISGVAILISIIASIFNVNPAAALTVGSFGGLVVGFATQTILSHVVAGMFLLLSRPFIHGDQITVSGQTGLVKEIKLMHLVLESTDRTTDILIPSGSVVTQIIQKKKSVEKKRPVETDLFLKPPPSTVMEGSKIEFTGRILKHGSRETVTEANIEIYDCDIGVDDLIASGKSGENGEFKIEWKAQKVDWRDREAEICAKFEGNDDYLGSTSKQYKIKLLLNQK
jgi:hypothetical protein